MSQNWPTRRHDIKIARLFIKKHSPVPIEELRAQNLSPEEMVIALYPWVPALITRFRKEHPTRDWMVLMLRAIDAVITPHFNSDRQGNALSQGIVACIRLHIDRMGIDESYDAPAMAENVATSTVETSSVAD
jgi:hypothetical protein